MPGKNTWRNPMRAYILTSGAIFGLITIAHLVRMVLERRLVPDPVFIYSRFCPQG
jgi:hypothetical protein